MIDRYTYPEMRALFELEGKYQRWLEVELAVCDALAEIGEIPAEAARLIRQKARVNIARALEIEAEVQHDLIAFVKSVTENMGEEAKYFHFGVTSYDIEDTALGLILRQACDILLDDLNQLMEAVIARAREHKYTLMMGRTHGVHAEPITFGVKLAVWVEELRRAARRIEHAKEGVSWGKISGAVGTYANIDPRVEQLVCQSLGLTPARISTQILQRDRHAEYMAALAITAASLEKFATEIRNLQRTEILEVEEPFLLGQRGSSAMPHKRNPFRCEQICGLARVVRGNLIPALENIATWHERDLTNSSVERVALADSSILVDYLLRRFTRIVQGLVVYPENMKRNLERTQGVIFSQQVMLALIGKGWRREDAYQLVQEKAMQAWTEQKPFRALLEADARVRDALTPAELDACFDYGYHTKHVDYIFERVGIA
jgi:adenylosuccinate lyase